MTTVDLTDADVDLLRHLEGGGRSASDLAGAVDRDATAVERRLSELADNAVVREREGAYELTGSGRRILESPGDGSADEQIDTPPTVERELESLDLPPGAEDAVRNAFTDVRDKGHLSPEEVKRRVFSEHPAGYDDPDRWWTDLVRDHLVALPGVSLPDRGTHLQYDETEATSGA